VHSIFGAISTEEAAKRLRCLSFCGQCVSWANSFAPALHSVLSNELHTNDNITCDESLQIWEKLLVFVFSVELLTSLSIEARHLQFVDREAFSLDSINDLSHLSIAVRLDHSKGSLTLRLKFSSCCHIAIINNFQDARQDGHLGAQKEIIKLERRDLLLLEEDSCVLDIEHLDRL